MDNSRAGFLVSTAYLWIAVVAFGGILAETIIIYPNVFHDVPASLATSMEFMVAAGPADFFPPMGALTVLAAVVALLVLRPARKWVSASLISLLVGEFLFSAVYFWPRNDVMFEEGAAVHSAEVLRQTAWEFETGHWVRLAMSLLTAVLAFAAFVRYQEHRLGAVR